MHALFVHFNCFGSAKIIEISHDLTDLQSHVHVHCYILGTTAKMQVLIFPGKVST